MNVHFQQAPNHKIFQTFLCTLTPGGASLSLFQEYAPPLSLPYLKLAAQRTPLMRRMNASILCLRPNAVSPTPHSSQSHPTAPVDVSFALDKVERFLATLNFDYATGMDGISSCVLKTCSVDLANPFSALFTLSFT